MTLRQVQYRDVAIRDIVSVIAHLHRAASLATAERFAVRVARTVGRLQATPEAGARFRTHKPHLKQLRWWTVDGFSKYLVFYRSDAVTIEIVRVLHSARDLRGIVEAPV